MASTIPKCARAIWNLRWVECLRLMRRPAAADAARQPCGRLVRESQDVASQEQRMAQCERDVVLHQVPGWPVGAMGRKTACRARLNPRSRLRRASAALRHNVDPAI